MDKSRKDTSSRGTFLQIRINEDLKEELRVAAEVKGLTQSALIHSLIVKAVREAKLETPSAFPDYFPPPVILGEAEFDRILFEALDAKEMTPEKKRSIAEAVKAILKIQEISDEESK